MFGSGVGCAVDLKAFTILSATGVRLSVRDLKRLAVVGFLLLLVLTVALAVTVLPLLRPTVRGLRGEAALFFGYTAVNAYGLLAFTARECLTRRRALPGGGGRGDFLRAVDLPPQSVCVAYLAVSTAPALSMVFVVDQLVVGFLAPTAGLGAVGVASLAPVPVAGALAAAAVVVRNAAGWPGPQTRRPVWSLALLAVVAVAAGAGLRPLGAVLTTGSATIPRLPDVTAGDPYVLLGTEAVVAICALAVQSRSLGHLRTNPYPMMGPARIAGLRRGLPVRGVEAALPRVLRAQLMGTPYGQLVRRLTCAVYLLLALVTGAWLVDHSVFVDGTLALSAGRLLVYAAFLVAIACSELVLLGAGPAVLRPQLRQLWEAGAHPGALAGWATASYVLVPTVALAALALSGTVALGTSPWPLVALGPTVAAAGLVGQALGRSDGLDTAPTDVSSLTAVATLMLSLPCLYLALHPTALALLGEICYVITLVFVAVVTVRKGILRWPTVALLPLTSTV